MRTATASAQLAARCVRRRVQHSAGCVCRASCFDVGSAASEVLGKRQRSECSATSDGGVRSAALPDDLRLNKAIGEAVESGLTRARASVSERSAMPPRVWLRAQFLMVVLVGETWRRLRARRRCGLAVNAASPPTTNRGRCWLLPVVL